MMPPSASTAPAPPLAMMCEVCILVLSLRRHDPDQVQRVFLSPKSRGLRGTPRNGTNVGRGWGVSMRARGALLRSLPGLSATCSAPAPTRPPAETVSFDTRSHHNFGEVPELKPRHPDSVGAQKGERRSR